MKIKLYVLDLEIPHRTKRLLLAVGIPAVLLLCATALVWAAVPNTFNSGDVLSAQKLNDNFSSLDARIASLEAKMNLHLSNADMDPGVCDNSRVGQLYYNTTSNLILLCTGARWASLLTNAACTDVTQQSMKHYGTGNCPIHTNDQSWLSSKVPPTNTNGADFGYHDSNCPPLRPSPIYPAFVAIDLGSPRAITRLRIQLHTNPMKGAIFQGSNDSTNGNDGSWSTITGPFDMPSNMELQWWEAPTFTNATRYRWYRLYASSGSGFGFYRWAMFEC
ncbi:MAG: hypothetical protein E6J91_05725 [Deltaproteobacteria bacterium]|nr:MAG: hypothetical protein E6J91_05725 [Deltaproteobacteria bacterium]